MSAISDEFDDYLRTVYTGGPVPAAQRLELARAFAAGGIETFGHIVGICGADGYSENVRAQALVRLRDDLRALGGLPTSGPSQATPNPCPRRRL